MSDELMKKMVRAMIQCEWEASDETGDCPEYPVSVSDMATMRAALLMLAENVSLEMEQAAWAGEARLDASMDIGDVISAAIRKAAE